MQKQNLKRLQKLIKFYLIQRKKLNTISLGILHLRVHKVEELEGLILADLIQVAFQIFLMISLATLWDLTEDLAGQKNHDQTEGLI